MEQTVTEITRRNILDTIRAEKISWHGRLAEDEFLNRIFNLSELPSFDSRYPNMEGDWWQHRQMNYDWDDDWVFGDPRLNIMRGSDDIFLNFLVQMVHPIVREDHQESQKMVAIFNEHLSYDGIKLMPVKKISGRDIYEPVRLDLIRIDVESENRIGQEFARDQLKKCDRKIDERDFDGAITNARSLLEGVFGDIYEQCTGKKMPSTGNLLDDYKDVKKLLNLADDGDVNDSLKAINRGLTAIIHGVDAISNDLGDRHRRRLAPERRHAKVAVNAAKTIVEFLYDTLDDQKEMKQVLLDQLHSIFLSHYGQKRWLSYDNLHADEEIKKWLSQSDLFQRSLVKEEIISKFEVNSFHAADVFFSCMQILLQSLNQYDVEKILDRGLENDQLVGMDDFIDLLKEKRAELMSDEKYDELKKSYYLKAECMRGKYMYAQQAPTTSEIPLGQSSIPPVVSAF